MNQARVAPDRDALRRVAEESFGWNVLREGQLDAMAAAARGEDVLAVMPSGHGKSAVYQVPAVALPGTAVVISPLIALQYDQVDAINDGLGARRAFAINSQQKASAGRAAWDAAASGEAKFLFLAPEQLAREETLQRLAELEISLFVVDEAHCISSWGHDFRPDYLTLTPVVKRLHHPPVVALTATASPHSRTEIIDRLGMRDPFVTVQSFDRPNLNLQVRRHHEDRGKRQAVVDQVAGSGGPGLLYTATRKDTERYAAELAERGLRTDAYHAGRRAADREAIHERFLEGGLDVVVATSAFGMGIDKPDVRFVVHADIPDSLDSYYQEIGRAGRDGEPAQAVLHYRSEDLGLQRFFAGGTPDPDDLAAVYGTIREHGPLRPAALRERTGLSQRKQARLLNLLEHSGSITVHRNGYRAVGGVDPSSAADKAVAEAESRHRIDESRIEMARGYAETDHCRRDWLLNYFGEETDGYCGNCDNCEAGSEAVAEAREAEMPEGYEIQRPVKHREWGPGIVMGTQPDRITVLFESVGYKDIALSAVREDAGLLESVEDQ
ncbi:RecQ family ATP-dependent DNA helicase [Arthrobacter sp. NPDC089319]|uniref:RecQ family ATP-dependent DNA helicase n=1 Tax=Arthrobacter sp. NPDC089319 TaxID=3155915 RepID=UPI0034351EDE